MGEQDVVLLARVRSMLRNSRQWNLADTIRNKLLEYSVAIRDRPDGLFSLVYYPEELAKKIEDRKGNVGS